jgi:hypothetical protein
MTLRRSDADACLRAQLFRQVKDANGTRQYQAAEILDDATLLRRPSIGPPGEETPLKVDADTIPNMI